MATINSYADVVLDWQNVVSACQDNNYIMKPFDSLRMDLERLRGSAGDINARRESAIGLKQQLTQELDAVLKEGREVARRLRGAAKAQLGTKNERLVQFKAAPLRDRKGRRSKSKAPTTTPTGTAPAV
jgi:hypothetical protein